MCVGSEGGLRGGSLLLTLALTRTQGEETLEGAARKHDAHHGGMHGSTPLCRPRIVRVVVAHRPESVGQLRRASPPPVDIDRMLAKGAAGLAVVLIALAVATEHLARVKVEW